jgi:hypothetical protein
MEAQIPGIVNHCSTRDGSQTSERTSKLGRGETNRFKGEESHFSGQVYKKGEI